MPKRVRFATGASILALGLMAALTGCGGDAADGARPVHGGTLVIAGPNDLGGMNALVAQEAYTQDVLLHALFLPLVRIGPDMEYEPALAESWTWEGDSAVTFRIRPGVRWHDGHATTARDVVFTFERARDPETAFPNASDLALWRTIEATDSMTVRLTVEPHIDPLLTWAFLPIMPAHALDSIPSSRLAHAAFNHQPIGNGPFRFVEYRANDRWVFEANPDFPAALGGRPWIDRVVWRIIPDNSAQLTELLTGNADLILSPRAEDLDRIASQPGLVPVVKPSRQYHFIGWNGRRPMLKDARVRRALTQAIDRTEILRLLRGGRGTLAAGPIAPFHWAFPDSVAPLAFDTIAARRLLDEAGLTDRNGDGRRDLPDGSDFRITLDIVANNPFNRDVAEMIQAHLARVGVRMEIRPIEFMTLIGNISSPERRFDAVLMGWEADFRLNLLDTFHSSAIAGPYQLASYSNPELDALLDGLSRVNRREDAVRDWHRVQRILRDDQPWTFLWYVPNLYGMRDRVRGATMDERGAFVNLAQWWLADAAVE